MYKGKEVTSKERELSAQYSNIHCTLKNKRMCTD